VITRRFKAEDGTVREEWFESYKDVPKTIEVDGVTYTRMFEAPTFRFKGAFSGATRTNTAKMGNSNPAGLVMCDADDGAYLEPGRLKDIERQARYKDEKIDRQRRATLAESFREFDHTTIDPATW